PERFSGRSAIVSGGADGRGAACVRRLAAEGARVVITDAKAEMGEALAARLRGEGHDVLALPGDVMDEAGFDDALDRAIAHLGSVDVLINVAGGSYHAYIADIALDQFDRIYRLNVRSTVQACQKVLPAMRQAGRGAIVNMASISGIASDPGWSAYNSAKAGIIALTKALAWEEGRNGIRANAICPGTTASERLRNFLTPERMREFASAIALDRVGTPDEQAAAILFLASDDASFITGATLVVDGGLTARGWQPTDFDRNHGLVRGG
ncbi:MAG: SDR family oxidoreductase, partial [Mesorhizobium sp.]|nr:SDR family oxidoreductase [Mesorhizobium sp.]